MSVDRNDDSEIEAPDQCPTCSSENLNAWKCLDCGKPLGSKSGAAQ